MSAESPEDKHVGGAPPPSMSQRRKSAWGAASGNSRPALEIDEPLPDDVAASAMPADFVEMLLKDRVRDSVLIRELLIFIPFIALFLTVSLRVVDIEHGYHSVGALKDLTLIDYFPSVGVQNRTVWQTLRAGQQVVMDPDTAFSDIGEQANWHDWTGFAVSKLFQCSNEELVHQDAASANVEGFRDFVPVPVTNLTGNVTNATNATAGFALSATNGVAPGAGIGPQYGILGNMSELEARKWLRKPLLGQIIPIGALRLRAQIVKNDSCTVPSHAVKPQNVTDSTGTEFEFDPPRTCYANDVNGDTELRISPRCYKTDPLNPTGFPMFEYKSCSLVGGVPTTTELGTFHCGGYTYDIPFNLTCTDALRVLYQVMDPECPLVPEQGTRFFILEYFAYTPVTDIFFSVKHVIEVTAGGAWIPSEQFRVFAVLNSSRSTVIVLDFFFLAYVFYYIVKFFLDWRKYYHAEGRLMRYFLDVWTLLDAINVATYIAVFVLRWMWWGYSASVKAKLPLADAYPEDLERLLFTFSSMRYAMAVNFILTFLKILKFLKISDRLAIVGITFDKAQTDVLGLLFIFTIVMLGYGVAGNTLFGPQLHEFASLDRSFSTLMFMLLGELDYAAMKIVNPSLAGLYFWTFLIIAFFLIVNFIVAVVSDAFTEAGQEQFVAPLSDAIQGTLSDIVWALSPSTIKLRLSLWRRGKTQYAIEKHMLGYFTQGHSKLKMKATGVEILITGEDVFKMYPLALRRDGREFFIRFWRGTRRDYVLLQATDDEQTKQARRAAIVQGTKFGLGALTPQSVHDVSAQLERVNNVGDDLVALLQAKFGQGNGGVSRVGSPAGANRPGSTANFTRQVRSVDESDL